ncbi:MAG: outer rane efflux protein [Labilithrix sp.]|nr:outer rane efflux protein [Labilithrix sp.]
MIGRLGPTKGEDRARTGRAGRVEMRMAKVVAGKARITLALATSLALLLGELPAARADAPPPAGEPSLLALSLTEAIARAEQRAPDVVLAGHAVREARAQRIGAGVVFPVNPRLSGDVRPPVTGGTASDLGYAAQLETYFDAGGAPSARVREADRGAELAVADLALERLRTRVAATMAYLRVRIDEIRIDEMKASVDIGERILRASQQRGAAGAAGDIDAALATSDLGQLRASVEAAIRQREEHVADLRDLLDLPPQQAVELTTPLETPPPPPALERLVARAVQARPELAQIKARVALLDARYERLGRERFPRLGAYVGVDAAPVSPIFALVGLSIELPVFQRNQGPRAVVEAERATEQRRQELQARRILREVLSIHKAYESRRAELKLIESTAVPAAQRTLELVEQGWLAGRFDVFRVATAARDVARVKASRLDALEAAWLARVALDRAAGGVTP